MRMVYYPHMAGYEMTEEDIVKALNHLRLNLGKPNATRDDAIAYLQEKHADAHMAAHKIVEDEKSGKIGRVIIPKENNK